MPSRATAVRLLPRNCAQPRANFSTGPRNKSAAAAFMHPCPRHERQRSDGGSSLRYGSSSRSAQLPSQSCDTDGSAMTTNEKNEKTDAGKRVLVVEDEPMIRLLLDDMLADLGYTMAAEAGRLDEALAKANDGEFDVAILDVNLNGQPITPVVEVLVRRGVPFVFATGYGQRGVPEAYRSTVTLQKPFQLEALEQALKAIAPKAAH